jgi:hypothetical protein
MSAADSEMLPEELSTYTYKERMIKLIWQKS